MIGLVLGWAVLAGVLAALVVQLRRALGEKTQECARWEMTARQWHREAARQRADAQGWANVAARHMHPAERAAWERTLHEIRSRPEVER